VKVGDSNEQRIHVVSGLNEGERVALDARSRAAGELKQEQGKDRPQKKSDDKQEDAKPVEVAVS
jgi:hypothetical protein